MKLKTYLKKAQKERWAIGQFNFSTFEILKGEILAAKKLKSPIILGTSENESSFFGLKEAVALVGSLRGIWPFIFLNLDHGKSFDYLKKAVEAGYDYIHFDGSALPFKENIKITKEIVKYAGKKGVLVEGEIDKIPKTGERGIFTKEDKALEFIKKTKVDSLAISVGNIHGVEFSGKNPSLYLERLKKIKEKLGNRAFLVLHGGSGTPKKDIKEAIQLGITKININTEIRAVFAKNLREALNKEKKENRPYRYLLSAVNGVKKVVGEKIILFGSKNKV